MAPIHLGCRLSIDVDAQSGQYAAHIGAMGSDATLSQAISTTVGQQYTLSFWLANNGGGPNDFAVKWNGATVMALTDAAAQGYTQYTYTVTATGRLRSLNLMAGRIPRSGAWTTSR